MSKKLNISVVVEGVESEKQVNCAPSAVLASEMDDEATQALLDPTILAK